MGKVAVLVEIDESDYGNLVKYPDWFNSLYSQAIRNGKIIKYSDAISREALKQKASHYIVRSTEDGHNWNELCVTVDQIDNAPSLTDKE